MGKMAILMILGLSFAVGIFTYIITQRSVEATDNFSSYYAYTNARNIAHSAVNIALREIELHRTSPYEGTFGLGRWRVDTTSVGDTVNMVARSWFMDASYVMYVTLKKKTAGIPFVESAVALNVDRVRFLMRGDAKIDGRDHDLFGNVVGPGLPGVTVPSVVESTTVVSGTSAKSSIVGTPTSIRSSSNLPDVSQFVDYYMANADYTYGAGAKINGVTWGSVSDPKIIFVNGGTGGFVSITGNVTGWGVLIIKGKVKIAGNFLFHGLVVVYQDAPVQTSLVTGRGTADILGTVLFAGAPSSFFELKGTPKFAYSSKALEIAAKVAASRFAYEILKWWE
ncbi:MAG: hypothetical protein ACE5H0_10315 [Bacteroidota bacterium]